jgi:hypothetical protein
MTLMHRLAQLSDDERRRIVAEFVEEIFDGLDADSGIVARMRGAMPALPDDPTDEQLEAWIELAELVADADFRAVIRRMAERGAADRVAADTVPDPADARRVAQLVAERGGAALADGIEPQSAAARPVVDELAAVFADLHGRSDGREFRAWLAEALNTFADRRAERYWQLLAVMNGWPQQPSSAAAWEWLVAGLRAGAGR